jgi:hypothetical protein
MFSPDDVGYILALHRAKQEWDKKAGEVPVGEGFLTFYDYIKEYYGIKISRSSEDDWDPNYTIVDDQKHLMFKLKFGG